MHSANHGPRSHATQSGMDLRRALCQQAAPEEQVMGLLLFDRGHCDLASGLAWQLPQLRDADLDET